MRLALLLWLICQPIPALSQQPPPPRAKPPVQKAKPDQQRPQYQTRGSQDSPFVVKLDSIQAREQAAQAQREGDRQIAPQWGIAYLTGGLLLIAFFQLAMFAVQLWMMRQTLTDAKDAAKAAQQSAEVAKEGVTLAKDTAQRQLRAYLTRHTSEKPIEDSNAQGIVFEFRPTFKNTGQTPALHVATHAELMVLKEPLPSNFVPQLGPDLHPSTGVVGPGHTLTCPVFSGRLTTQEVSEVKAGTKKSIFLYGVIRYNDIFDHPRHTEFFERIWWRPDGPKAVPVDRCNRGYLGSGSGNRYTQIDPKPASGVLSLGQHRLRTSLASRLGCFYIC